MIASKTEITITIASRMSNRFPWLKTVLPHCGQFLADRETN